MSTSTYETYIYMKLFYHIGLSIAMTGINVRHVPKSASIRYGIMVQLLRRHRVSGMGCINDKQAAGTRLRKRGVILKNEI